MAGREEELLRVEHVKYRTSDAGRSPIGTVLIFKEHLEWRDSTSPNRVKIQFKDIKGQRVSPPHKPKVQLQVCMMNEDQATFVFLTPGVDKEELVKQRELVKETLQQALVVHRQRVQQLTNTSENSSKKAELVTKQKILEQSKQLEELYKHLVSTKLITPQDFWKDYYKSSGETEEDTGMTGAFLANVAQSDTNGLKLNLNTTIINNIFATYPMVERKHLELVPHEMTEEEFWVKFATSHYFHREREVLPNPDDPFSDCVKNDEEEMTKILEGGPKRKRLDLQYLSDYSLTDGTSTKKETNAKASKTTLIRRCNYLSERILSTQLASSSLPSTSNPPSNGNGLPSTNGLSSSTPSTSGYSALHRWVGEDEDAMESAELAEEELTTTGQPIKLKETARVDSADYDVADVSRYKSIVQEFVNHLDEKELVSDDWDELESVASHSNGVSSTRVDVSSVWTALTPYLHEIRVVHDAVCELAKHFWTCFPPTSADLEAKIDRMEQTLKKYEETTLLEAEHRFGEEAFVHCRDMINRVHTRYQQYSARRKK